MRIHRSILMTLILVLIAAAVASAQAPGTQAPVQTPARTPDVPYVPSDDKVVAAMLDIAKVKKSDILYDLGSGDGRIPITAAKRFGTRGTGVEIDPVRVAEARENAKKAGVEDRVRFIEGDIFEADIKNATVVMLYLLPDVNLKLRPKLLSELKPGTRIVSHNYDMGDWEPEKSVRINLPNGTHVVYFWTVPAPK
jgi:predicted O-methyltransferase YrrM